MANQTKYWKGLAHLNNTPSVAEKNQKEFAEYIPVEEFVSDKNTLEANTSRRDFLKFLGFSTVAATLAACEAPVTKAVPYVNRPEEITPGVANWYASTFFDGHDYASVLVKTREGRPIKLEGNTLSKLNGGGTNARTQAAVLSLYDSTRLRNPRVKAGDAWTESTWDTVDGEIAGKLKSSKGIAIISSTIISPSTLRAIKSFADANKDKTVTHVMYDAVSYSGVLKANLSSFGKAMIPTYNFDKADVIVGIGCDFLGNWLTGSETERQYGKTRKVGPDKKTMSKHYQFEAQLSLTGANADERFPVKPSQYGEIALGLLQAVGGDGASSSVAGVDAVGAALKAANGKALVVCGSNDPAIQLVVNAINEKIGAYSAGVINTSVEDFTHQGDDAAFKKVVEQMGSTYDAVIFYNANPAYSAPKSLGFEAALANVSTKITFATHTDETAALCDYILPDHNFLEAWGDHMPRTGQYSLQQPAIRPLFSTRHAQESFLKWSDNPTKEYMAFVQETWKGMQGMQSQFGDFNAFWINCVRDGVFEGTAPVVASQEDAKKEQPKPAADDTAKAQAAPTVTVTPGMVSFTGGTITMAEAKSQISATKGGAYEVTIYAKSSMGSGNQANNPWLQEMPDPITKITWDNYVTMHPTDAQSLSLFGLESDGSMMVRFDQMEDELDMVNVTVNGHTVKLPVWVQPGQAKGTIGIAVGYGRKGFNEYVDNIGQNIYPAVGVNAGGTMQYTADAQIAKVEGETYRIAATQTHHTMMGRNEDILRETTLAEYVKDEKAGNPAVTMHTYKGTQAVEDVTLWNDFERPNHKWALAIDLNSCIGCGSCVVACTVENNVPVVGRDEIRKSREMHWLRIDRYYSSDTVKSESAHGEGEGESMGTMELYRHMENPSFDNPKVAFQPIMCQHCNHAGCETVCPVIATTHSNEGLNQMTYNRCVGTRYCANNCPYKVRRFNWFNYVEYHRFKGLNPAQDDIGRMVLNPDVTVRARGVMEKCSMCSQRIQEGKLNAKKAGTTIPDQAIKTACQQSCPTDAIIFGDLMDENSLVAKMEKDGRKFEVLEVTGSRPSVFYMTKVWNRDDVNAHI